MCDYPHPPSLVVDPGQVKDFFNRILHGGGTHVLQLQARPKYGAPRDRIFQRVRSTCDEEDFFLHKVFQGAMVPPGMNPDHLVLYSTTNPIDVRATNLKVQAEIVKLLVAEKSSDLPADRIWFHSAPSHPLTSDMRTFDVDVKEAIGEVMAIMDTYKVPIREAVETRGGYHLFTRASDLKGTIGKDFITALRTFTFQSLSRDGKEIVHQVCSLPRNTLCAIPGTLQGGFPVHLLTYDELDALKALKK